VTILVLDFSPLLISHFCGPHFLFSSCLLTSHFAFRVSRLYLPFRTSHFAFSRFGSRLTGADIHLRDDRSDQASPKL
jgi:hypothetical protein